MNQDKPDIRDPRVALGASIWLEAHYQDLHNKMLLKVNARREAKGLAPLDKAILIHGTNENRKAHYRLMIFLLPASQHEVSNMAVEVMERTLHCARCEKVYDASGYDEVYEDDQADWCASTATDKGIMCHYGSAFDLSFFEWTDEPLALGVVCDDCIDAMCEAGVLRPHARHWLNGKVELYKEGVWPFENRASRKARQKGKRGPFNWLAQDATAPSSS